MGLQAWGLRVKDALRTLVVACFSFSCFFFFFVSGPVFLWVSR